MGEDGTEFMTPSKFFFLVFLIVIVVIFLRLSACPIKLINLNEKFFFLGGQESTYFKYHLCKYNFKKKIILTHFVLSYILLVFFTVAGVDN